MKKIKRLYIIILTAIMSLVQASYSYAEEPLVVVDTDYGSYAQYYLKELCYFFPERYFAENKSKEAGDYIKNKLDYFGYDVYVNEFTASDPEVKGRNISCEKKGLSDKTIVICAHYDSVLTQGCDDNASGVSVVLEAAARISAMDTPMCTIRFVFFDDEEQGYIGSREYLNDRDEEYINNILCVINIDSIAGGDNMYIHGGTEEGEQTWFRDLALDTAKDLGLDMTTHPEVTGIPEGTRFWGSDHHYFATRGIPYIYLEANIYSSDSADGNPVHYQTENEEVVNGQIMHTEYDDYETIERLFPGRISSHLKSYTILTLDLALNMDENGAYTNKYYLPSTLKEPETTEAPTTEEITTEEITTEETTIEETTTKEPATEEKTTVKETTVIETTAKEAAIEESAAKANPETEKEEQDEKKTDYTILIIVITVCVVVAVIAGISTFALVNKKRKKSEKSK